MPSTNLSTIFSSSPEKAKFIGYLTAGYPHPNETVDLLLAMQSGGTDIIELGVPYTDPQADGSTIQKANETALRFCVNLKSCINMVRQAREKGLRVPVLLMGYYNPFCAFGLDELMIACKSVGIAGFIVVDLPPEEGFDFIKKASNMKLVYVPLVSPTTTSDRISYLSSNATSFIYCVSVTGKK